MFKLRNVMKKIAGLITDQKGVSLVLVALFLVVLIGFAAFCVDAGMLYKTRREMVNSADAASLAGAKAYVEALKAGKAENDAKIDAENEAKNYAKLNGAQESLVTPEVETITHPVYGTRKVIEVRVGRNEEYAFAKVLGFTNKDVMARAVATWGYVKEVTGGDILPLFVLESEYKLDDPFTLHFKNEDLKGNWGFLDVGSGKGGDSGVTYALKGGTVDKSFIVDNYAFSETGNAPTPLINAIEYRMQECANGKVTMYGLVPLVEVPGTKTGGKLNLLVKYFAVYLIEDVITDEDKVTGNVVGGWGSEWADFIDGGSKTYYTGDGYVEGTIIGHFTGETVDVSVVIQPGDQNNPNDPNNPPTTYVKLID